MDLAEQHDPEEWRKIMQRFFSILADAVGGSRAPSTSSPATGSWPSSAPRSPTRTTRGAPATRRCRCSTTSASYAAELRRAEGLNFSIRIGINSGEVVAGAIGGAGEGDYTAIGHTVGLAQRMEALAEPGKAYLTESTAALAARLLRPRRPGRVRDQGGEPAAGGLRAGRRRPGPLPPRPLPRPRLLPLRRALDGDGGAEEALERGARGRRARGRDRRRAGRRQEPPLPRVLRALPRRRPRGLRGPGSGARPSIPFMPVLQMLRAFFGIGDREHGPHRAREDRRPRPAARSRASPRSCRCCSTSSASPTPSGRRRR